MSDDLKKKKEDSNTININEAWEVRYWTDVLKCTKDQLVKAIETVGNSSSDVRGYFDK